MPDFYFVDRYGTCREGAKLELQTPHYAYEHPIHKHLETTGEVEKILTTFFSEGLSIHGNRYLLEHYNYNVQAGMVSVSPVIELIAELVRRLSFPDKQSRFQAFFVTESIEDAKKFRMKSGKPFHRIFRVQSDIYFRGDMTLLTLGQTAASSLNLIHKYWNGESSVEPFWEVLLCTPVHILEQVEPKS